MTSFSLQLKWPHYSKEPVQWKVNKRRPENWWGVWKEKRVRFCAFGCCGGCSGRSGIGWSPRSHRFGGSGSGTSRPRLLQLCRSPSVRSGSVIYSFILSRLSCYQIFLCETYEPSICGLLLIIHRCPAELWTRANLYAYTAAFCLITDGEIMNKSCTTY